MAKWKSNYLMDQQQNGIFIITNHKYRLICENPITKEVVDKITDALNKGEELEEGKDEEDE